MLINQSFVFKIMATWLFFNFGLFPGQAQLFEGAGTVTFLSDAPLEKIEASSNELNGLLNLTELTFAFTFQVNTFEGFNGPLQKEHFNEHYLETEKYPKAFFSGKLVGLDECRDICEQEVFAKGKLIIHGITKIVTIPVQFERKKSQIKSTASFNILLQDFGIEIPLILEAKISSSILVEVVTNFILSD